MRSKFIPERDTWREGDTWRELRVIPGGKCIPERDTCREGHP